MHLVPYRVGETVWLGYLYLNLQGDAKWRKITGGNASRCQNRKQTNFNVVKFIFLCICLTNKAVTTLVGVVMFWPCNQDLYLQRVAK